MTLLRRFPAATVEECQTVAAAVGTLRALPSGQATGLVVIHRATDADGLSVVEAVRAEDPAVAVVFVSARARSFVFPGHGPSRVVSYDDWPTIGLLAEELLGTRAAVVA